MNMPICDFLEKYAEQNGLRCHMPGHKGRVCIDRGLPQKLFSLDITEICGADSLFEAEGIIAESERNMSCLYNTAETVYSAAGSTLCIQAMLALMKQENRKIIAVRNVHRAFLNACALLGLDVQWIYPVYTDGILSGKIDSDEVERALAASGGNACLYVTSPDYTGRLADIAKLSEICRRYGAKLLVDNAHGAHLAFMPENIHPIALGADLCCDSAHKMLPAMTGAAMLHTASEEYKGRLRQAMSLFASTSPSYPIMASLDMCCGYIHSRIKKDIADNIGFIADFKSSFEGRLILAEGDPFHITIRAAASGFSGIELSQRLREYGVECEYADSSIVVLLMSPVNKEADYTTLSEKLEKALSLCGKTAPCMEGFTLPVAERAMGIREAVFAPCEEIPAENAEGRICGAVRVPCPPAVPIAVSGEIISGEHINIFKRYGISAVNVVK